MEGANVPKQAGPVPDRVSIWPLDDGRFGLDATFQGASGFEQAEWHAQRLKEGSINFSLRQELSDGWSLRFGPLTATEVSSALRVFVR